MLIERCKFRENANKLEKTLYFPARPGHKKIFCFLELLTIVFRTKLLKPKLYFTLEQFSED